MRGARISGVASPMRRGLVVAAGAALSVVTFFLVLGLTPELWVDNLDRKASSVRWRLSTSLADTAILLLSVTLAYGSVRVLLGKKPSVHLPWRRTLGVGAGVTALTHLVVGLSIHGDLSRPWLSFFTAWPSVSHPAPLLRGGRGVANWAGLAMATLFIGLIVISNRAWLRRLGAIRWKTAQRSTYVLFLLVGVHTLFYWRVEQRLILHRAIVLGVMVAAVTLQLLAATRVRQRARDTALGDQIQRGTSQAGDDSSNPTLVG